MIIPSDYTVLGDIFESIHSSIHISHKLMKWYWWNFTQL